MNKQIISYLLLSHTALLAQNTDSIENKVYTLDAVQITSSPLAPEVGDMTNAWSAYKEDWLAKNRAQTIGETLSLEPGVAQSYYGPNASRPIIRGQESQRVRVLQNNLEMFDVSAASVDHAVAIDPLLIERVELLRGSSALLYGANAIGGVVNTIDRSIPGTPIDGNYEASFRSSYTTVNEGFSNGAVLFTGNDNFSIQANGSYRETEDYDTPSFKLEDGSRTNTVANSHSKTWTGGLGASYFFDGGYAGVSYSNFDTEYGVPNEESPTIKLERERVEARANLAPKNSKWLQNIEFQMAYGDYQHDEVEQDGAIAATYIKEGIESRLSFLHKTDNHQGVLGLQANLDRTKISGEENALAGLSDRNPEITKEDSDRMAIFFLEEFYLSPKFTVNGGIRFEYWDRKFQGAEDRDDLSTSISLGLVYNHNENWSFATNVNYTERLPETLELYSDGPHLASGSYEVGDPSLDRESAIGFEAIARYSNETLSAEFVVFYTRFSDYIYLNATGNFIEFEHAHEDEEEHDHDEEEDHDDELADHDEEEDHDDEEDHDHEGEEDHDEHEILLAEHEYKSSDAEFYGFEIQLNWKAITTRDWSLTLHSFSDAIWAENTTGNTDLPRIAPWRIGAGAELALSKWKFGTDLTYTGSQKNTAPEEEKTAHYIMLNAYASYAFIYKDTECEFFVKGTNLTDELAYVHTSFLKDTAPLAGIGMELGANISF